MEAGNGANRIGDGVGHLAGVLQTRMHEMGERPDTLDYGVIQDDMSILLNKFPVPIPQTDYMVCRQLTLGPTDTYLTKTAVDGEHSQPDAGYGGAHKHVALIPEKMRHLQPGDRVLVVWVDDEPCVIDLVLPATEV